MKKEYNCEFFMVSAKTGEGVNDAFNYLVAQIYAKNRATVPEPVKPPGFKLKSTLVEDSRIEGKKKK